MAAADRSDRNTSTDGGQSTVFIERFQAADRAAVQLARTPLLAQTLHLHLSLSQLHGSGDERLYKA